MSFHFPNPDGSAFDVEPCINDDGTPVLVFDAPTIRVPLDQVEEVIAGIRDEARQAAKTAPASDRGCQCIPGIPCDHCHATTPAAEVVSP